MLDLLLPRPCAGCGSRDGPWCLRCAATLPLALLDLAVPLGPALADAVARPDGDLSVVAATPYADSGRRLLLAFKEGGRHELGDRIAGLLARAVLAAVLGCCDVPTGHTSRPGGAEPVSYLPLRLVPIPSRPRTRRSRGADLGLVVARLAAIRLRSAGWDACALPLLRHRRTSVDQAGLNRSGRLRNVTGTLSARRQAQPASGAPATERLVVVDDILTTGATLREAARALLVAGYAVASAAVVAATPAEGGASAPALQEAPLSTARGGG